MHIKIRVNNHRNSGKQTMFFLPPCAVISGKHKQTAVKVQVNKQAWGRLVNKHKTYSNKKKKESPLIKKKNK